MRIVNSTKGITLADNAKRADSFFARLAGLLGRKALDSGEALIISPSDCIHSFFMRFPIDVIFLDRASRVIKTITPLNPWRATAVYFNSVCVIELPSGVIKTTQTQVGDIISIA